MAQGCAIMMHSYVLGDWIEQELSSQGMGLVIDVGCGRNIFKHRLPNVVGFDIRPYPSVDLNISIEEAQFEQHSASCIIALGSIQFGTRESVWHNLVRVNEWLKPGGLWFMRVRSPQASALTDHRGLARYQWQAQDRKEWADKLGLVEQPIPPQIEQNLEGLLASYECWTWLWKKL